MENGVPAEVLVIVIVTLASGMSSGSRMKLSLKSTNTEPEKEPAESVTSPDAELLLVLTSIDVVEMDAVLVNVTGTVAALSTITGAVTVISPPVLTVPKSQEKESWSAAALQLFWLAVPEVTTATGGPVIIMPAGSVSESRTPSAETRPAPVRLRRLMT